MTAMVQTDLQTDRPAPEVVPPSGDSPAPRRPSLSPSRAADFKTCPLLYRFRTIDRLPERKSLAAVRGTLVHSVLRSEEHTSELQSRQYLVCRLLLEKKKNIVIVNLI